ncbi:HNH endonuclease [Terrimonas rubra]|uniref:HNH endonuclease n=1 Tax=Terrimonas rubra TaxID=1035890 RepID=A0ABW6A131_9BACT
MKTIFCIIIFFYSYPAIGQDSLSIDTSFKPTPGIAQQTVIADSPKSPAKGSFIKKKMKKQTTKRKAEELVSKSEPIQPADTHNRDMPIIMTVVFVAAALMALSYIGVTKTNNDIDSKEGDFISDQINRILLPRREYYRNFYLKSAAWKRKRYLVLKRDNWRCAHCGEKATQVHHKKYAKNNIGKEPIEWLEAICKSCHDAIH